jgi:hypothetical protein
MTPEQELHMRETALGRIQAASSIHRETTVLLMDAIRSAHKTGASKELIRIESGLPIARINRVLKGGML